MRNLIDIAWAAGIHEGEGHCLASKSHSSNYHLRVIVDQNDHWLCDVLKRLYGGNVIEIQPNLAQRRPNLQHRWGAYGDRAAGFLMTIYSFLSPRKQLQVEAALAKWREDNYREG